MSSHWLWWLCLFFLIGNSHGFLDETNHGLFEETTNGFLEETTHGFIDETTNGFLEETTHGFIDETTHSEHEENTEDFPTQPGVQYYDPDPEPLPEGAQGIVGGKRARANAWPWQINLQHRDGWMCGGALIDTQYVLTAAHCFDVDKNKNAYKIKIGMHDIGKKPYDEELFTIKKMWLHENYIKKTIENDIALLRLDRPIKISRKANTICLPGEEATGSGKKVWVVGWGAIAEGGRTSRYLKEVALFTKPTVCPHDPFHQEHNYDPRKQMCAGTNKGGSDSCQGDSGGPLMYRKDGIWYLNGIVSYGDGCGVQGTAGAYVRVKYYLPWINKKMGTRFGQ